MKSIYLLLLGTLAFVSCDIEGGDGYVTRGSEYFLDGQFELAETELKQAIGKKLFIYSEEEVYTIIGNLYNEMYMFDSSIVYHQKALDIDPNYADALVNLGIVYRLTMDYDKAADCYAKAAAIDPNNSELQASIGALHIHMGKYDKALKCLKRSIELDSQSAIAHANYAYALAIVGEFDSCNSHLTQAEALGYENGDTIREHIEIHKAKHELPN